MLFSYYFQQILISINSIRLNSKKTLQMLCCVWKTAVIAPRLKCNGWDTTVDTLQANTGTSTAVETSRLKSRR